MNAERGTLPQLLMRRPHLGGLPCLSLPQGLALRVATTEDEEQLSHLLSEAFGEHWTPQRVGQALTRCQEVDSVFVAERRGELLATASARLDPDRFPGAGYVHWVGTLPTYRGAGLGTAVTVAVLRRFAELGCTEAVLETDDDRVPAIRMYLSLGFVPALRHPADAERWRRVASTIGGWLAPTPVPGSGDR